MTIPCSSFSSYRCEPVRVSHLFVSHPTYQFAPIRPRLAGSPYGCAPATKQRPNFPFVLRPIAASSTYIIQHLQPYFIQRPHTLALTVRFKQWSYR